MPKMHMTGPASTKSACAVTQIDKAARHAKHYGTWTQATKRQRTWRKMAQRLYRRAARRLGKLLAREDS